MQIQIKEEVKEKYGLYNRIIQLATLKEHLQCSNKVLAESVEEFVEVVAKNLNKNKWSFDNDPDGKLKKEVMSIIENY
jgi:cell wall assembly regulator SMI1